MSAIIESREVAIWRRVIRPETAGWSRAGAEAILHLDFQEEDDARMVGLQERAKDGVAGLCGAAVCLAPESHSFYTPHHCYRNVCPHFH